MNTSDMSQKPTEMSPQDADWSSDCSQDWSLDWSLNGSLDWSLNGPSEYRGHQSTSREDDKSFSATGVEGKPLHAL